MFLQGNIKVKGKKKTPNICKICLLGNVLRHCNKVNGKPEWGEVDISNCRTAVIVGIVDEVRFEVLTELLNYKPDVVFIYSSYKKFYKNSYKMSGQNINCFINLCIPISKNNKNQNTLECDSRMPKKEADKKFQTQNNLAPVLQCFVID